MFKLFIAGLFIFNFNIQAKAKLPITFLTTEYCPLICKGSSQSGIMIDILSEIFKNSQYDVSIVFRPIKRAFLESSNLKYDGFIGGDQTQLTKNIFPKYITTPNPTFFYKLKTSRWNYKDLTSLKDVKLAAVKTFNYPNAEIFNYIQNKENKNVLMINLKNYFVKLEHLILTKRIDVFIAGELSTQYNLKSLSVKEKIISDPFLVGIFPNYLSVNPKSKHAKKLLEMIDKGFLKIYKDGTLQKIYKRYGVNRKIGLFKNPKV